MIQIDRKYTRGETSTRERSGNRATKAGRRREDTLHTHTTLPFPTLTPLLQTHTHTHTVSPINTPTHPHTHTHTESYLLQTKQTNERISSLLLCPSFPLFFFLRTLFLNRCGSAVCGSDVSQREGSKKDWSTNKQANMQTHLKTISPLSPFALSGLPFSTLQQV